MYKLNYVHSSDREGTKKRFCKLVESESERIAPMIREQLLREYILGTDDNEAFDLYCRAFDADAAMDVRMVILKPSGANNSEIFFFIKNAAQHRIGGENLLLTTIFNDFVCIVTTVMDKTRLTVMLDEIREDVLGSYDFDIMAVYSKTTALRDIPKAYERLTVCLGYSFYVEGSMTLYENDVMISRSNNIVLPEYGAIEHAIRSGDCDRVKILISSFFKRLQTLMPAPVLAKTYCLELYICIIRCCSVEKIDRYMKGVVYIREVNSAPEIRKFIEEKGLEITRLHAPAKEVIYSSLIRDTINIIDDNIDNEHLSLRWLAGTILYTNVDYLGKLFKKETGKNFSHYVMEKRMELAKELIFEGKMDRIYEVAETVGYGSNSQYFSQVFKKYTGVSPLEYKEFARLSRQKNDEENNS